MAIILLAAVALMSIPILGTHPGIARFISNSSFSKAFISMATLVALLALLLWGVGIVQPWAVVSLSAPLYQIMITRTLFRRFVTKHDREPVDAAFNFSRGIAADREYAFAIIVYGLFIPVGVFFWMAWGNDAQTA